MSKGPSVPPRFTDSEWLAPMVSQAFAEERYDLGEALARLCAQAYRMERDRTPLPAPVPVHMPDTCVDVFGDLVPPGDDRCAVAAHGYPHHRGVPVVTTGPTIPGFPEGMGPDTACPVCGVPMGSPGCNDYSHPSIAEGMRPPAETPAETAVTAVQPVVPSTRCTALVESVGGRREECHRVVVWRPADSVSVAGWEHYDGITDHDPVPLRQQSDSR